MKSDLTEGMSRSHLSSEGRIRQWRGTHILAVGVISIVGYVSHSFSTTLTLKISKSAINQLLNTLYEWASP